MKKTFLILLILSVCLSAFAESVIDSASFNIFAKYGNTDSSYTLSIVNLYGDKNSEIANNQRIPVSIEDFDSTKTQKDHIDLFKVIFKHTGNYDKTNNYKIRIKTSKGFAYSDDTVGSVRYNLNAKVSSDNNLELTDAAQKPEPETPGNTLTIYCPVEFRDNSSVKDFTYELTVGVKVNEEDGYESFKKEYIEDVKDKDVAELTFTVSLEAN